MTDQRLELNLLPSENPAVTLPAGWVFSSGSATGCRINNGLGFFATGGTPAWAGWSYDGVVDADENGDYVVDITATTNNVNIDSYSLRATLLNADGGGYFLTQEAFVRRLHRVDSGGITGAVTNLVNSSGGMAKFDVFTLKYNPTTGSVRAFKNGTQILSTTDTTYDDSDFFGGFAGNGFNNLTGVDEITVYNVAAAATLTIATDLTPNVERTDTCAGFADGAATISFAGVSVAVTIASGSFTWTVPALANGATWPRLPSTGATITLTQGEISASALGDITLPAGYDTLRVGDVDEGAPANFLNVVTDDDKFIGYHLTLLETDTWYNPTLNGLRVYRNGDVESNEFLVDGVTLALPRTDVHFQQDDTGLLTAHTITITAAGLIVGGGLTVVGLSVAGLSTQGLSSVGL